MDDNDLKVCVRCNIAKPRSEYYPFKRAADGLRYACKRCCLDADLMYKQSEGGRKKKAEWNRNNPGRVMLFAARRRAKLEGLPFALTPEDIVIPDVCPILGIHLVRGEGQHAPRSNSPSLDRIDPKLGYVPGNIQVISNKANAMKNNATPEELRAFADWVYKAVC